MAKVRSRWAGDLKLKTTGGLFGLIWAPPCAPPWILNNLLGSWSQADICVRSRAEPAAFRCPLLLSSPVYQAASRRHRSEIYFFPPEITLLAEEEGLRPGDCITPNTFLS